MITTTRPDNTSCAPIPQLSRDVTIVWEARSVQILIYYYILHVAASVNIIMFWSVQPAPAREKPWVRPGPVRLCCLTNLAFGNSTGHFLLSYRFGLDPTFYTLHTY